MRMNALNIKALFFWVLSAVLAAGAHAATVFPQAVANTFPIVVISDAAQRNIEVGIGMGYTVDPSRAQSIDQIRNPAVQWQPITRTSPSFGFVEDAYWFRFQIDNRTGTDLKRLIELPRPFLDDVRLFHQVQDQIVAYYTLGDEHVFSQRKVRHQNFIMPVQLNPGLNQIYLRLASSGVMEAPLKIWEPMAFSEASADEHLLTGAMMGTLAVMVVYNLFLLLSTRDLSYAYYIAFVASYLFFLGTLNGYTFAYLWPNAVRWNGVAISTFVATACLSASLFASKFLKLQSFSKVASSWMFALTVLSMFLVVSSFVAPYALTIRVGVGLILTVAVSALAIGYWRWWKGASFARLYCLAWTCVFAGFGVLALSKFGVFPENVWVENSSQIGVLALVLLLSFTLADRINNDRSLRLNAQAVALAHAKRARASQHALIKATERANQELERRVASRTNELNTTLGQLQSANGELQRLSTTDSLTQIGNRAFFDNALYTEHKRANRLGQPLALILFDIDHFKAINDTYGHPVGDVCLRHLAELMRYEVQRAGDLVARYGGEEFVILLLNSTLAYAMAFANEFRRDLESSVVSAEGHTIRFTASFGVACALPDPQYTPEHLLIDADRALYQAKREGRNCVRAATAPSSSNFNLIG
jgi:two-component system, sensor histidine kinase LadS